MVVNAHGSIETFEADSESQISSPHESAHHTIENQDALIEHGLRQSSGRPTIMGYETHDCNGRHVGSFVLSSTKGLAGHHCLAISDGDTDNRIGFLRLSCDSHGAAKVCIWHQKNDTGCALSEPFCLVIDPVDTQFVSTGVCLHAIEIPASRDTYTRFLNFPIDTVWPACLQPPIEMSQVLLAMMGGVVAGVIVLSIIWYCFLAQPWKRQQGMKKPFGARQSFVARKSFVDQSFHDQAYAPGAGGHAP
jgi:hypothetical protein